MLQLTTQTRLLREEACHDATGVYVVESKDETRTVSGGSWDKCDCVQLAVVSTIITYITSWSTHDLDRCSPLAKSHQSF
jgi:hypothetical protein